MLGTDAANIFLTVASVCVVLLTVLLAVLLVFLTRAVLEVCSFARFLRSEAEHFAERRRRMMRTFRFARRWLASFLRQAGGD